MNAEATIAAEGGAKIEKLGKDGVAVNMDVRAQAGAQSFHHGQVWADLLGMRARACLVCEAFIILS